MSVARRFLNVKNLFAEELNGVRVDALIDRILTSTNNYDVVEVDTSLTLTPETAGTMFILGPGETMTLSDPSTFAEGYSAWAVTSGIHTATISAAVPDTITANGDTYTTLEVGANGGAVQFTAIGSVWRVTTINAPLAVYS